MKLQGDISEVFSSYIYDNSAQDVYTTLDHKINCYNGYVTTLTFKKVAVTFWNIHMFVQNSTMYFMSLLAHCFGIIIDREIFDTNQGKYVVYVLKSVDKHVLVGCFMKIYFP